MAHDNTIPEKQPADPRKGRIRHRKNSKGKGASKPGRIRKRTADAIATSSTQLNGGDIKPLDPENRKSRPRREPKPGRSYKGLTHAKNGTPIEDLVHENGYAKPPEHTKFRPGQSGNLKGRPKGAKGLKNILLQILDLQIVSRSNGTESRISTREGIGRRIIKKALEGDYNAIKLLIAIDEDFQLESMIESTQSETEKNIDDIDIAILDELTRQILEQSSKGSHHTKEPGGGDDDQGM